MSTASVRSQYFTLHTTGNVTNLRLEAVGKNISFPIYIDSITINAHYPFNFVLWRFVVAFVIMGLIVFFRPKSMIYRVKIRRRPTFSKAVICATVAVETILLTGFLLIGTNYVGFATSSYNYGE